MRWTSERSASDQEQRPQSVRNFMLAVDAHCDHGLAGKEKCIGMSRFTALVRRVDTHRRVP